MTNMIQHKINEPVSVSTGMVPVFCTISYLSLGFPVEQKQPYDKYDIVQNTGTISVEQKQPNDKYDIVQNTGTIPVETETTP